MKKRKLESIAADAFFDNFSLAVLFGRLRIPGAPKMAVDPRTLEQFLADERMQSKEDITREIDRIVAESMPGFTRQPIGEQTDRLITGETLKSVLMDWSQSSLKPLENASHSR
jgi:hypothetical protein